MREHASWSSSWRRLHVLLGCMARACAVGLFIAITVCIYHQLAASFRLICPRPRDDDAKTNKMKCCETSKYCVRDTRYFPPSFLSLWLMGDGSPLPLKASQGPYRQNWDHGHAQWPRSYVSLCCPVNTVCPIHLLPQTPHRKVILLWDDSTNQCSTMYTTMTPHCHAKLAITLIQIPGRTPPSSFTLRQLD